MSDWQETWHVSMNPYQSAASRTFSLETILAEVNKHGQTFLFRPARA